jgi:hypothetical protein
MTLLVLFYRFLKKLIQFLDFSSACAGEAEEKGSCDDQCCE